MSEVESAWVYACRSSLSEIDEILPEIFSCTSCSKNDAMIYAYNE